MFKMVRVFALFVILNLAGQMSTSANAGEYYASPNGSDANDGSLQHPWHSIMHAVTNTRSGDTIYLRVGVYTDDEIWIRNSEGMGGSPGMFKTIAAYPGEKPILKSNRGILIYASWIRIKGISFVGNTGVSSERSEGGCDHIEIVNNVFKGGFGYGAIEIDADNSLVRGNTIEITKQDNTRNHGIYLHWGKNNVLRDNKIFSPKGYGIHVYDEKKSDDPPGIKKVYSNILIEKNFVSGSKERSGIIVAVGSGVKINGVVIRQNVIVRNKYSGISIQYGSPATVKNINILNNTFFDNSIGIDMANCSWLTIKNNIFKNSKGMHIFIEDNVKNVEINTNLYFPKRNYIKGGRDANPIFGRVYFASPDSNDFHITRKCKSIDKGLDVGLPFFGNAPDLGAFEFIP